MIKYKVGYIFWYNDTSYNIIGIIKKLYMNGNQQRYKYRFIKNDGERKLNEEKQSFAKGSSIYTDSKVFKNEEELMIEML